MYLLPRDQGLLSDTKTSATSLVREPKQPSMRYEEPPLLASVPPLCDQCCRMSFLPLKEKLLEKGRLPALPQTCLGIPAVLDGTLQLPEYTVVPLPT